MLLGAHANVCEYFNNIVIFIKTQYYRYRLVEKRTKTCTKKP
jgi:hypothetical protein